MNAPNRTIIKQAPWDLRTWEEIAKAAMVSVRSARRYAKQKPDPLPVSYYGGAARACSAAVHAWVIRHQAEDA